MSRLSPGAAELDGLLKSIEADLEGGRILLIPITPSVVRYLLRGEFHIDGHRARLIGGTLRGDQFVPTFHEVEEPTGRGPGGQR